MFYIMLTVENMNPRVDAIISVCLVYLVIQTTSQQLKSIKELVYDENDFDEKSFHQQRNTIIGPTCDCDAHNIKLPSITFYQLGGYSIGNKALLPKPLLPQHQRDVNDIHLPRHHHRHPDNNDDDNDNMPDVDKDLPDLDPQLRHKYHDSNNDNLPALDPRLRSKFSNNGDEDASDSTVLHPRLREPRRGNRHDDDHDHLHAIDPRLIPTFRQNNNDAPALNPQLKLNNDNTKTEASWASSQPMVTPAQWKAFIDALSRLPMNTQDENPNSNPNTNPNTNPNAGTQNFGTFDWPPPKM